MFAAFGWWFPEEGKEPFGWDKANTNALIDSGSPYDLTTGMVNMKEVPVRGLQGQVSFRSGGPNTYYEGGVLREHFYRSVFLTQRGKVTRVVTNVRDATELHRLQDN